MENFHQESQFQCDLNNLQGVVNLEEFLQCKVKIWRFDQAKMLHFDSSIFIYFIMMMHVYIMFDIMFLKSNTGYTTIILELQFRYKNVWIKSIILKINA